jgi:hypothetical protein
LAGGIGHEMLAPERRQSSNEVNVFANQQYRAAWQAVSAFASALDDRKRPALIASAELTAWSRVNQPDYTEIVIGAGRLAERFPFFIALLLGLVVRRLLGMIALLIVDTHCPATVRHDSPKNRL